MNTWELIKQDITRGTTPGTVRYLERVRLGASVYATIRPKLKTAFRDSADRTFNADNEVTQSFALKGALEGIL